MVKTIKLLYTLPLNAFALVSDKMNNVYLININKITINNLFNNSDLIKEYLKLSNNKIKNYLFESFDLIIEEKYTVNVNQKTLERVKNFFK